MLKKYFGRGNWIPLNFDLAGSISGRTPVALASRQSRWRDGHAGQGGLPHQPNLRRGRAVGLVDEVAKHALYRQGFGGEGAGGRAEKLKLGKQKAGALGEVVRNRG